MYIFFHCVFVIWRFFSSFFFLVSRLLYLYECRCVFNRWVYYLYTACISVSRAPTNFQISMSDLLCSLPSPSPISSLSLYRIRMLNSFAMELEEQRKMARNNNWNKKTAANQMPKTKRKISIELYNDIDVQATAVRSLSHSRRTHMQTVYTYSLYGVLCHSRAPRSFTQSLILFASVVTHWTRAAWE